MSIHEQADLGSRLVDALADSAPQNGWSLALVVSMLVLGYFLPALIAVLRRHRNGLAIFATNLLVGWTLLGWVVALVWSLTASQAAEVGPLKVCPHCAERVQARAVVCRYCGRDLAGALAAEKESPRAAV